MARSLTVKHEESTGTSSLFTAFLLLACAWLAAAAVSSASAEHQGVEAQPAALFNAE